jgi:CHASE2 domain-containing sensor protein
VVVAGLVGFLTDLAIVAAHRDPFDPTGWPVPPQLVIELQLACMLVPLILGLIATITKRGRRSGIAAIALAVLGNLLALGALLALAGLVLNGAGTLLAPHEASSVAP